MKRNLRIIGLSFLALVSMGAVAKILVGQRGTFTPQTATLTYERDIRQDKGVPLTNMASLESVQLSDVFDEENFARYGADGNQPDGVGLDVVFRIKRGATIVSEEKFTLPRWETFEPEPLPVRRQFVEAHKAEFEKMAGAFLASKEMSFTFAIVVDTTEGVSTALTRRVVDTVNDAIGSQYGKADVRLYQLYEMAYQGGRTKVKPTSVDNLKSQIEGYLAGDSKPRANSSVVQGLASVLADVRQGLKDDESVRVDVFTDGLENTEAISIYREPTLLVEQNWPKLDAGWNPAELKFQGLEIHLHPLPPRNSGYERLMTRGLHYLKSRLAMTGATVVLETI